MVNYMKTSFPSCAVDESGKLYYVTHEEHALKKLYISNGRTEYVDNPNDFSPVKWAGVDNIFYKRGKIYLFDQNGSKVLEYSLLEKTSRLFSINCTMHSCFNIAAVTILDNKMFIWPSYRDAMIIIDLQSEIVTEVEGISCGINYTFNKSAETYIYGNKKIDFPYRLFSCGCRVKTNMWIFFERESIVICYNLLTGTAEKYHLPQYIKGSIHVIWKEERFYILGLDGSIYLWEMEGEKAKLLWDCCGRYVYPYFLKIMVTDENIWLLPSLGEDIFIIDLKTMKETRYNSYPNDFEYYIESERSRYFEYCEDANNYYVAMHCTNYMLIISKLSGKGYWIRPQEPSVEQKIFYYMKSRRESYKEDRNELKEYLNDPSQIWKLKEQGLNIGELVWKMIQERN